MNLTDVDANVQFPIDSLE